MSHHDDQDSLGAAGSLSWGAGVVRLSNYGRSCDDLPFTTFDITVTGIGLSASINVETLGGDGLPEFVQSLDDDFRGWSGERVWVSLRKALELRAVHKGRFVKLSWTLRHPEPAEEAPDWTTTVHIHITPGEELKDFAAAVRAFLNAP